MIGQFKETRFVRLLAVGVVGVNANGGEQVRVAFGETDDARLRFELHAHAQGVSYAVFSHAGQDGGFVFDELRKIQMTVGVDEH